MIDLPRCVLYLVPGAAFATEGDTITAWNDPRPQPTFAECEAAWPAVQAADVAAAQAATTAAANEKTIGDQVDAALAANKTFLAIASPNTAQNAAQIKALTRQMNGLIRLVRRKLEAAT